MHFLLTLAAALVLSGLAGWMSAIVLGEWADGDESYILAFMAIPIAMAVAAVSFLVALTRPRPLGALSKVAVGLLVLVAVVFAWMSLLTLTYGLESHLAWRSEKLTIAICATMAAVVIAQWLVFRAYVGPAAPAVRVGRGPGAVA